MSKFVGFRAAYDSDFPNFSFTFFAAPAAISRARVIQRLAHANSSDRMLKPIGMTTNAGPGSTINAMPTSSTVIPTTKITIFRADRRPFSNTLVSLSLARRTHVLTVQGDVLRRG